jgi:hypothetical protein
MNHIALFFAGALLCNCIPHLACGLRGESFPTPFAKPRGIGLSSPLLNFIWGTLNGVAGGVLLARHGIAQTFGTESLALLLGFLVLGTYLSMHFAKVRQALS